MCMCVHTRAGLQATHSSVVWLPVLPVLQGAASGRSLVPMNMLSPETGIMFMSWDQVDLGKHAGSAPL